MALLELSLNDVGELSLDGEVQTLVGLGKPRVVFAKGTPEDKELLALIAQHAPEGADAFARTLPVMERKACEPYVAFVVAYYRIA